MALEDLASAYGPTNGPFKAGTGTILGPNNAGFTGKIQNGAFGNPTTGAKVTITHNNLDAASHHSLYGPFNSRGTKSTGLTPDLFGNVPKEIDFNNYP